MSRAITLLASGTHLDETRFGDVPIDAIADVLAARFATMKYGGSNQGLMFLLAEAFARRGGAVIGVHPRWLKEEGYVPDFIQSVEVESMARRKEELLSGVEALLCLPGGVGTLDELFTHLAQVSFRERAEPLPVFFYDHHGYYRPLELMFHMMGESGAFDPTRFTLEFLETPHHLARALSALR